jgi:hypothetical protein
MEVDDKLESATLFVEISSSSKVGIGDIGLDGLKKKLFFIILSM